MSFVLSKALWAVVQPGNLLTLLLAVGAALLFGGDAARARGRTLVSLAAAGFLVIALLPLAEWLARPLEERFPRAPLPERVDGVIMLGGAVGPRMAAVRGEPAVNAAAERILAFVELARRWPDARLVFTGGSGSLLYPEYREDATMRAALAQIGFDAARVIFEGESRNTWENAVFSRHMIGPKPGETWVLVTSAMHMPRSVGIFRHIGWPVIPHPVDYRTYGEAADGFDVDLAQNLDLVTLAVREWIGLAAYRLMGRTGAFFPHPDGSG